MPGAIIFVVFLLVVLITAFFVLLPRVRDNAGASQQTTTEQQQPASGQIPQAEPPAPIPQERDSKEPPLPQDPPQEPTATEEPAEPPAPPPVEIPPETRDRGIYFLRVERGGAELRLTMANRKLSVSSTPLRDSLNALLAGPTAEERNNGLRSYIPPDSRMIGAEIRGNTAHLNFNEEFRYNPDGREGCIAQIQQIVWTATEFPNVHDVQFLIEGNVVDFLSEGVMIRNPIGR